MSENQRDETKNEVTRVKVTDKRRVRPDREGDPAGPGTHGQSLASPEPPVGDPLIVEEGGGHSVGIRNGVEEPTAQLEEARKEAAAYLDHLKRLQAEFENYRKRVLKEQTRAVEMASEPLVRRLLEVIDEFELALMAAEKKPDFDKFLHGVELVYAKLKDILGSEGLQRIEAEGKPFDPTLHEALMQGGEAEGEPVVADVLRPGYTMKGRVIRPAGVRVVRK